MVSLCTVYYQGFFVPNYTYVVMCIFIDLFSLLKFVVPACGPDFSKVVLSAPRERLRGPAVMCGNR